MYTINQDNDRHLMGIAVLIIIGAIIGACLGLWVAAMTIPLPHTDYYYMTGRP